jgi:1-deoxyxylulose-5-phosphate synthase
MEYVNLGTSSLKVSRLCIGALCMGDPAWRPYVLPEDGSRAVFKRALDHGFNLIDTSNYYSMGRSEEIVGRLVKEFVRRDDIIIATKFGNPMRRTPTGGGYSRKNILAAVDASLRRLQTDYIDLYQTHIWQHDTDLDEMVDALDYLVRVGKILYSGITVMPVWSFVSCVVKAKCAGRAPFVSVSNHYNLLWREDERELLPFCRHEGIGVLAHSVFARGMLCGRQRRAGSAKTIRSDTDEYAAFCYGQPEDYTYADLVEDIAGERGVSAAQLALAWVLSKPAVHSAILGATRPEQLDDAVTALSIKLSPEEMQRLEKPYRYRQAECIAPG